MARYSSPMRLLSLLCVLQSALSFSVTIGSTVSAFGGDVLVTNGATNSATMEMKKGKANVPPQMRQQFNKQREMAAARQEMIASTKPGEDGLPVFNLFVRTPRANVRLVLLRFLDVNVFPQIDHSVIPYSMRFTLQQCRFNGIHVDDVDHTSVPGTELHLTELNLS